MKLRVLFIESNYFPLLGGTHKMVAVIGHYLKEHGFDVAIVAGIANQKGKLETTPDGIRLTRLSTSLGKWGKILFSLKLFVFLFKHRKRYDAYYCPSVMLHTLVVCLCGKLFGIKTIATVSSNGHDLPSIYEGRFNGLKRMIFHMIDHVQVTTKEIDEEMDRYNTPKKIRVHFPSGVDVEKFKPAANREEREEYRRKSGILGEPAVIFVGIICKIKGIDILLDVWESVASINPKAHLYLIGDAIKERLEDEDFNRELHQKEKESPWASTVHWMGARNDVADCLKAGDIFVLPSQFEGLSIALLEAAASGMALICSRVSGSRDVVKEGINGFLHTYADRRELLECFTRLINDPEKICEFGKTSRQIALQNFDIDQTMKKLMEILVGKKNN